MWTGSKALAPLPGMVVGRLVAEPTRQQSHITQRNDRGHLLHSNFHWTECSEITLAEAGHTATATMAVAISADDGVTWKISLKAFVCTSASHAHASSLAATRLQSTQSDGPVTCIWGHGLGPGFGGDIEWRPRHAKTEALLRLRLQQQQIWRLRREQERLLQRSETLSSLEPRTLLSQRRSLLKQRQQLLDALSPDRWLSRGFAKVIRTDGTLLQSASHASPGDDLVVQVHDGLLEVSVARVKTSRSG